MSSSGRRRTGKKVDPLNKRIPENPRYAHVGHVVDSGASVSKYLRHLEEIKQNYRYRKDEIFKRLKPTTFAQLVLQVEMHDYEEDQEEEASPTQTPTPLELPCTQMEPSDTPRSTLNSVISGMGELDIKELNTLSEFVPAPPPPPPPYILLDVRDRDEYEQGHIITAKHYPPAMLNRSCNFFTKDILDYKNKPGKIIILYDEDERIAPQVASTFVQREVDNVFMLSGGLKVLYKIFSNSMITGEVPPSCLATPPNSARKTGSSQRLSRGQPAAIAPGNKIPQVGSAELKEAFTEDDLDKIQESLDTALLSGSGSRASSRSSSTVSSHRSNTSSSHSIASSRASSSRASTSSRAITTPWK